MRSASGMERLQFRERPDRRDPVADDGHRGASRLHARVAQLAAAARTRRAGARDDLRRADEEQRVAGRRGHVGAGAGARRPHDVARRASVAMRSGACASPRHA